MIPSSSRVKLNRVALKDVVGLKAVPRRRRVPNSLHNETDSRQRDENQLVSGPESPRGAASPPGCCDDPVQTLRTHQTGPDNVTGDGPGGEPEEDRVDTDRNTPPSPTGLSGSEGSSRRAVRACIRDLCGDCKYVSPQWKTLGKRGPKSAIPGQHPTIEVHLKEASAVAETPKKIIVWMNQYPKVTLCDVAQKSDSFSNDCGYVLPDVLKTKVVHCFKQDMRAGFRFEPGCFGHNEHESEEGAVAKNREFCPRVQSEKSLTEHQRHLKERTHAQTSHTPCHFLESWASEGSATCSASFLLGKRTEKGECRTGMWDRDVEEKPGPGPCLIGAEICTDKRIKLGDLESISRPNPAKPDTRDKEKTCFWMSGDGRSRSEHAAGGSGALGSGVNENAVHKKPCGEMDNPTKTDAAQMSSELFCQRNDVDMDELESFTCQRVRVYFRKLNSSCARTYMSWPFSNSGRTLPAEPVDPSATDFTINRNQPSSPRKRTNDVLPEAPTDTPTSTAHQVSHQNKEKREEDSESGLAKINGTRHDDVSSYSSDSKNMESAPQVMEAEESTASFHASSMSTPSPSALGLSDWETATTLSSMSSPFTHGGLSSLTATPSSLSFLLKKVKSVDSASSAVVTAAEKTLFDREESQMTSCSFASSESSLLLPQDEESDEELLTDRSPPKLVPYYNTSPYNRDVVVEKEGYDILTERRVDMDSNEFMLPPMLSPVTTPQGRSWTSSLPRSPGRSDDEEEEEEEINSKHRLLRGYHTPQFVNGNNENSEDDLEHGSEELDSPSGDEDVDDGDEGESRGETDCEDHEEHVNKKPERVPSDPKVEAPPASGVLTEPCSSPSSDEDNGGAFSDEERSRSTRDEASSPSEMAGSQRDEAEAVGDTERGVLDEVTAYEQDILLVDVTQDDPELFENLPQESLLKLGPVRVTGALKTRPSEAVRTLLPRIEGASLGLEQRLTQVKVDFHCDGSDITDEGGSRPWRPQCGSNHSKAQGNTWPATDKQTKYMGQPDANNNHVKGGLERSQPVQTVNSLNNHIPPLKAIKNGPLMTNPANMAEFRRQKSINPQYCWNYFSELLSCGFKMCRFQHVPVEGDEKLCIETVVRFSKNPMCLQRAGAVFTGYYQNNPPGVYFSTPVLLSLLWALLKAGMVSDVFSVLSVSLAHKIVPGHEFVLALFNFVREKSLMSFVPELMQLTSKMASAGLVLSLDCLDSVKNTPEFQQTVHHPNPLVSVSGNHKLSPSGPFTEYLNLAHAMVEIELCTKQEDWRRMGEVFGSICQSSQHPNQVERISGRVAISLLSESKDKLSPPFAAFAETVCQNEGEDSLIRCFVGRIGVSLMLRYHKTHQWAKGRRVVEVLSMSKVNYSTLKGLFGNEDGASRCCLVTVATELFLLSGSVEGALNTLRENNWFLSSCSWPCEPADLESRTRVLMRLAEKTSHRDTLDVLCNLPGLKEPTDLVDVSRYAPLFKSHLQVCVDRQTLPVASDTVDFMLSKKLAVDPTMLQMLLHKLGKQNLWLRAREVFRHALSVGYYPGVSAPHGFMTLLVPCGLGEVELALAFEMFITVNAAAILHLPETSTSCLGITLKRTNSCESEYLSAGSRLLSAACIPQPKLIVHYTAVNSSQEQVFTLDICSARCWLRHNHLWANEVWTH